MRRAASLICLSLAASSAFAQGITVSDDVTFTRGPEPWGPSVEAAFRGVSSDAQASHIARTGWAFRIEGDIDDPLETLLPPPDTQTYAGAESEVFWSDLATRGLLSAIERTTVVDVDGPGGNAPGGRIDMSLQVTNIRPEPLTLSLFHVIDPDLSGTPANDAAALLFDLSEPTIRFQDNDGTVADYSGNDVDAYSVRAKGTGDVVAALADDDIDNPGDDGLPSAAIDATAMFAWQNRTLAPGESLTVRVRLAVNSPLLSDLALAMTASPSPATRGTMLEYAATVANVSNATHPSPASRLLFDLDATDVAILGTQGCDNDPMGYPVCELGLMQGGESRGVKLRVSPGLMTESQISMTGTVGSPLTQDIVPQDNSVSVVTDVLDAPDLSVEKKNDRNGVASDIDGWTWTLTLRNDESATGAASFETGQTLLLDQTQYEGIDYGPISWKSDADVTGTFICGLAGPDLSCIATSPLTIPPGATLSVTLPALPSGPGIYTNPRVPGGVCTADFGNVIEESDELNNNCFDSVEAVDFMMFSDGFEG